MTGGVFNVAKDRGKYANLRYLVGEVVIFGDSIVKAADKGIFYK